MFPVVIATLICFDVLRCWIICIRYVGEADKLNCKAYKKKCGLNRIVCRDNKNNGRK